MLVHSVYFWLKKDLSQADRDAFLEGLGALSEINVVRSFAAGMPASTDRPVVEKSYDFALLVLLDDMEAHDVYQESALHQEFLGNFSTFWEKVVVYDFET